MELFDLVDENDNVIGVTDKQTAHSKRQNHRVSAVYVFNDKGDLYVQVHKKSGGRYDHSVGGHVIKGETYAVAAQREAAEELSIRQPLKELFTFYWDKGTDLHMFGIFECVADKNWKFKPNDEVEELFPMKLNDIRKMMKDTPKKFTSGFIASMKEYCEFKGIA